MAEEKEQKITANKFLEDATKQMANRATLRDQPEGERSMAAIVRTFNAITGHSLTEAEGWEFMILLKMVRGRQGKFNMDDYTDMAAYAGLLGECESTRNREPQKDQGPSRILPVGPGGGTGGFGITCGGGSGNGFGGITQNNDGSFSVPSKGSAGVPLPFPPFDREA